MNTRIKALRKSLSLTLEEFGKKLGVTRSAIGHIEKGTRGLTEQMILSISREFNVDEEWLRTGQGEMFLVLPEEDEVTVYVTELLYNEEDSGISQLIISAMRKYYHLDPVSKKAVNKWIESIVKDMKK